MTTSKKTASLVKQVQTEYPDVNVDAWTMDKHRQGCSTTASQFFST
ncbi:MAG: hypothetical protein U7123_01510 [Potamolinea sp.]